MGDVGYADRETAALLAGMSAATIDRRLAPERKKHPKGPLPQREPQRAQQGPQVGARRPRYFCPQQKLVSKDRDGAKVSKKYDTATTPHRRTECHEAVSAQGKAILADAYAGINPAAAHRRIQALTSELLALAAAVYVVRITCYVPRT